MEWYMWLVAGGAVLVLGVSVWLYFKYVKGTAASGVVGMAGKIAEAVAGVLPDDASKLDVHDVVLVVGRLAEKVDVWAKDPANATWADCQDEILAFIEDQRATVPALAKLPKETLEKAAQALFTVAKMLSL